MLALPILACKAPEEPTKSGEEVQPAVLSNAEPDTTHRIEPDKVEPDKTQSSAAVTPRNTPYYYSGDKVLRVKSDGKHEVVAKFTNLRFCVNDPHHDALWLLGG
ncbi:MAG: hypothetical protein JKY56_05595, partial [Kofleriaceae bacterium]|nr:hypothetical protein [Kofleriaceae bacterium]